ncbi:MAG: biopolymer transporter ExbD [Saprospiraceae bacterium]|nr:biopolymer transporter ExbD [Saprospiraceae bacterium]
MPNATKRRYENAINASSMADIAFLLLIFFLVTTTILNDKGIMVQLPPFAEDIPIAQVNQENVLTVLVNANNELLLEGEKIRVEALREKTKNFITNPLKLESLPDNPKKAIISLQNDRGTNYETYIAVYNELKAAYRELWNEAALNRHNKLYAELPPTQQKKIRDDIPLIISEAEPTGHGKE